MSEEVQSNNDEQLVMGVDLGKVDRTSLDATMRALNIKPGRGLRYAVQQVASAFLKVDGKLGRCDVCGGASPLTLPACPFCGVGDEEPEAQAALPLPRESKPRVSKSKKAEESKPTLIEAAEPEPESEPRIIEVGNPEPEPEPEVAIVVKTNGNAHAMTVTEKDLDAALTRIAQIRERGSREMWLLGRELLGIYSGDLWKMRVDADDKPRYKTFAQFIDAEVNFSKGTVFRLMGIVDQFTEEQLAEPGVSVLRNLLSAPKEARQKILDKVEKGEVAGARAVDREAKAERAKAGTDRVERISKTKTKAMERAEKASAAASKKAKERKAQTVTVPFPAGRKTLPALARTGKAKDGSPKRARSITDRPWVRIECINGINVTIALVKSPKGDLQFIVEAS